MDDLHISLKAEELFKIGPIPVTNSMLTMFIVMALVLLAFTFLARRVAMVPGRAQGFLEMIVEFLLNMVESAGGKTLGRRIFPLVSGVFIFILFANLSGLLPGMGTVFVEKEEPTTSEEHAPADGEHATPGHEGEGEHEEATPDEHGNVVGAVAWTGDNGSGTAPLVPAAAEEEGHGGPKQVPILRAPTADLNMTLALSLLTFTVVQIAGVSAHGVVGRIKHMANPPFLFPIELISEFSRILSLAARLFGNVFAGEVLLGIMYAMGAAIKVTVVSFLFPVVFLFMEVLFGTIQALVFALLTLIYITLAAAGHDDHGEEHAHEDDHDHAHGAVPAPVAGD